MTSPPSGSDSSATPAHELLHRDVLEHLFREGWESLRPVQEEAVRVLLESEASVLITASTAAGKTEAAFLPIVSRLLRESGAGVGAVYVGPLKALINDQFQRMEDLCGRMELPVTRWHGDVGSGSKARLLEDPAGVLLITPESIESLFLNRTDRLEKTFTGLPFLVIDELHVFLGTDRGRHLQSLIARLRRYSPGLRLVGLSATIGDPLVAQRFLSPDDPDSVVHVNDETGGKELRLKVHAYPRPGGEDDESDGGVPPQAAQDLLAATRGKSAMIFANRRQDVEEYAAAVRAVAAEERLPDRVLVHHGSLATEVREDAERRMKEEPQHTVFCSSTLELGIDIGDVELVGQLGAPWSVAGFLQRIGRSGRKGGKPRVCRVYLEHEPLDGEDLFAKLQPELLQTVAVVELMLQGWMEGRDAPTLDLSTLAHQTLAVIAERGGCAAQTLHEVLCGTGAFREVDVALYAELLRALAAQDLVEQEETGDLILGLEGERLVRHYEFYSVFRTSAEFQVVHGRRKIGALPLLGVPEVGEHLVLAGRRWRIEGRDLAAKRIEVLPAAAGRAPRFDGVGGEVDGRVRAAMREALLASDEPPYLDAAALAALGSARAAAAEHELHATPIVPLGRSRCAWFTFSGSAEQRTLQAWLRRRELEVSDRRFGFSVRASSDELRGHLEEFVEGTWDAGAVAAAVQPKERRKLDAALGEDLLDTVLEAEVVRVEAAQEIARVALDGAIR